ncbi:MAG TPA: inositol monophosphatase family protein [Anaerolineales bacterium]|nr:inositol monophosphatase family protein [Anaerolineales bacterium]
MSALIPTYLDFARQIAQSAGDITLQYFQSGVQPNWKADQTPVTIADKQSELHLRQQIETRFPRHGILGEEQGEKPYHPQEPIRWILDPIDGTRAFSRGVVLYGVLVAVEMEGQVVAGVAHFPAIRETIYAGRGMGCWWNGQRAQVSSVDKMEDALLLFGDINAFGRLGRAAEWERLQRGVQYRAGWADAYGQMLIASGRAEISLEPYMEAWDAGPFPVILDEAGGRFGDFQGHSNIYAGESVTSNAALWDEVLRRLAGE